MGRKFVTVRIQKLILQSSQREDETTVGPFTVKSVFSVSPQRTVVWTCVSNKQWYIKV